MILDCSPPVLNYLKINGILSYHRSMNITLQAHYIFVSQGILKVGSEADPYVNQAEIILHG